MGHNCYRLFPNQPFVFHQTLLIEESYTCTYLLLVFKPHRCNEINHDYSNFIIITLKIMMARANLCKYLSSHKLRYRMGKTLIYWFLFLIRTPFNT